MLGGGHKLYCRGSEHVSSGITADSSFLILNLAFSYTHSSVLGLPLWLSW